MLKSILKLDGAKTLSKTQQKNVLGGSATELTHQDDGDGGFNCHCNGTTYYVANCKWCGWKCGAGTIQGCTSA
ncbi:hypothetical protein [Aquimarina sp. 2201CG5-10]|uniref:hypothetical protein n=1 Tax=Aquimarina callyspongiae TaxID=3098150 RepID=UPI002AB5717B|nr:hypothetical protein [Aquimarina sp. 2201CG5-10]MDY8136937.1 hypothetical protein [Aquimarina sp. 2201CG5-10]